MRVSNLWILVARMKQVLRAALAWLDRKFPDRIVITTALYEEMLKKIERADDLLKTYDEWAKKTGDRLTKCENEINKLNAGMGFTSVGEKLRAAGIPFQR